MTAFYDSSFQSFSSPLYIDSLFNALSFVVLASVFLLEVSIESKTDQRNNKIDDCCIRIFDKVVDQKDAEENDGNDNCWNATPDFIWPFKVREFDSVNDNSTDTHNVQQGRKRDQKVSQTLQTVKNNKEDSTMTKVITFVNQKGGMGKRITAGNLSTGLARQGKKILLIDADALGNLTDFLC